MPATIPHATEGNFMLVLARKLNESIVINGPCTVTLMDASPGKVRLGVVADKDVEIWREEMFERGVPRPERASIGRAEAERAGLAEKWAELRRLVDRGAA